MTRKTDAQLLRELAALVERQARILYRPEGQQPAWRSILWLNRAAWGWSVPC